MSFQSDPAFSGTVAIGNFAINDFVLFAFVLDADDIAFVATVEVDDGVTDAAGIDGCAAVSVSADVVVGDVAAAFAVVTDGGVNAAAVITGDGSSASVTLTVAVIVDDGASCSAVDVFASVTAAVSRAMLIVSESGARA